MTQMPIATEMNEDGFADLVDLHGPDAERWPARLRPAAASLLARSAEARLILEGARLTEELLLALPHSPAGAELRRAIAAIPREHPHPAASPPPARGPSLAARALAGLRRLRRNARPSPLSGALASGMAAAVIGFIMGVNGLALPMAESHHAPAASPSATIQLASAIDDMALEQTP